jgi:AcrR family transcriptional regulator
VAVGVGLDRQRVVEEAAALADEAGADAVTLAALAARLGVRSQSLYAHVDGLDGLRRDLAALGQQSLADRLARAAMGRSGEDALRALCEAYAAFAAEHPGLYACSQRAPDGDPELEATTDAATEPWHAVLRSLGLPKAQVVHVHRALWAALHGFVTLRAQGLMTRAASPDRSFALLVDTFAAALTGRPRRPAR